MELSSNWKDFQSVFRQARKQSPIEDATTLNPAFFIVDSNIIISAYSDGEDLSEWLGSPSDEIFSRFGNRELVIFDRAEIDHWLAESTAGSHFFEQAEFLKEQVRPYLKAGNHFVPSSKKSKGSTQGLLPKKHFLLEAVSGWWRKVFPSSYGVLVRIEGAPPKDLLLTVRRGELSAFQSPDLSSLPRLGGGGTGLAKGPAFEQVVKSLSDEHLIPVQGLSVSQEIWDQWSQSGTPWKDVFQAYRSGKATLYPRRMGLISLIAARAMGSL